MAFQNDLVTFGITPSQYRAHVSVKSDQVSAKIPAHDAANVEQESSSDIISRPSLRPSSSLESCSHFASSCEESNLDDAHVKDHEEAREDTPGHRGFYEFVAEDPTLPASRPDRRPRSKEERQEQKAGIRILRQFGGACLWCYRSKKKCGPANPCPPCLSNRRKCIRSPDQLHLISPIVISLGNDPSLGIVGPLSPSELGRLCRLGDEIFQRITRFHAVINFRPHEKGSRSKDPLLSTWITDVSQDDAVLSRRTRSAVDQFTSKLVKYVQCSEFAKLRDTYSDHPLAQTALKVATLFINICSTLKATVHVHPFDMDPGRLTMFVILVVCSQDLAEMSDNLAVDLCDALRRKDRGIMDRISGKRLRQRFSHPLDPVWVATALYHRVVCGLLDFYSASPAIRKIWGPVDEHLSDLRNSLWCVLKSTYSSKGAIRDTLDEHIPSLSPTQSFDLAFWLGPISHSEFFDGPGIMRRPGDPFAESCWEMELFLSDELGQSSLPIAPEAFVSNTEPVHTRSSVQTSSESSKIPEALDNILDPFRPTPWELMAPMDTVYTENLGSNFDQ